MRDLKVGIVQHPCSEDRRENLARNLAGIEVCAGKGADLVVLPELHTSRYFCQSEDPAMFDLSQSIPGPDTDFFSEAARIHGVVLVTSLFEKRAPGIYHNTAVVFDRDGSMAGKYRKMHIPDDPAYYEKFYFTPGDLGFAPIETSIGRLGVLVCWDQWFPEAARLMAMAGAEILIFPTAIGYETTDAEAEKARQLEAWITIQRAHAIANGLPLVAVNRTGFEPDRTGVTKGIEFWGNSFVAGPQGEVLYSASQREEIREVITLPGGRTEAVRRIWPYFRDRRIDAYGGLLQRYLST